MPTPGCNTESFQDSVRSFPTIATVRARHSCIDAPRVHGFSSVEAASGTSAKCDVPTGKRDACLTMKRRFTFTLIGSIAAIFMTATAVIAFFIGFLPGHQVDPKKLALLKAGMTKADVIAILGEPSSIDKSKTGYTTLVYASKPFIRCCCVQVFIDNDKMREPSVFHDCFQ